jgi:hypothetical protein
MRLHIRKQLMHSAPTRTQLAAATRSYVESISSRAVQLWIADIGARAARLISQSSPQRSDTLITFISSHSRTLVSAFQDALVDEPVISVLKESI